MTTTSTRKIKAKRLNLDPIEKVFENFTEIIDFELGQKVGGYLLRQGDQLKIVFGFSCEGIHSLLSMNKVGDIYESLAKGLASFPEGETLTFHQKKSVNFQDREAELVALEENCAIPEINFLLKSERKRLYEISNDGLRQLVELDCYCTYTIGMANRNTLDGVAKFIHALEKQASKLIGENKQQENLQLHASLKEAYYEGFEPWLNFIISTGLNVKPYSSQQLQEKLISRFGLKNIPIPPAQIIHVMENGLELTKNSELNPISRIFLEHPVPVANEKYIRSQEKYLGICSLDEKADGWSNAREQLSTIWKVMSQTEVRDTEIFVQIKRGDLEQLRENMRLLAEEAKRRQEDSEQRNEVNLAVGGQIDKAIKAGEKLYEDIVPFETAVVIVLHRDSLAAIDRAHKYLKNQFRSPLVLTRENVYPWDIWTETFPISWNRLLSDYDRTNKYSNQEVLGIMPLVNPVNVESGGIEFLSAEGGVPINMDLWNQQRHLMIIATSRAGKGIAVTNIINHDLIRGIPTSIIDYPNDDGTGTYTDYVKFLGKGIASYFEIGKNKINIMGIPDLSRFNDAPTLQRERMVDFKAGVVEILETMVAGANPKPEIDTTTIKSLLTIAVEKFYDHNESPKIYRRFTRAFQEGFGSPAWNNTPTLQDFIGILGFERLRVIDPSPAQVETMRFIIMRLKYWLSSKIGKAISAPSTNDTKSLLTVYALTKLSDEDDAAVLTLAINQEAGRKSLAYNASSIIVDEASIQIRMKPIAKMVARITASGLKGGIRVTLLGQDIDSIAESEYQSMILGNVRTRIIGLLADTAAKSMIETMGYDPEVINNNCTKKFEPIPHLMASNWLLDQGGHLTFVRYFADSITLAAAANNKKQVARRAEVMAAHREEGKFIGIKAYADELVKALTS